MIREGDICLTVGRGWSSRIISWWSRSAFSHAQLVSRGQVPGDPRSCWVIEVGWKLRETQSSALGDLEFVVLRPTLDDGRPAPEALGRRVADDALRWLRWLEAEGKTRYPWWKLPLYMLPWRLRKHTILGGPRQVCSVFAIRSWVSHGLPFYFYGADVERVDDDGEILAVAPVDIERNAVRRGWEVVHATPEAPALRSG